MTADSKIMRAVWCALLAVACTTAVSRQPAVGGEEKGKKEARFLRLTRDQDGNLLSLDVAVVRCGPLDGGREGPTVDLVGAVHVAEKSYYERLNREFAGYDAVLYELVAPEGTKIPAGGAGGGSPVSMLQRGMKTMLELEFQLEVVDYNAKNMVHADMSPEQFARSMKQRGESVLGTFLRMMGYAMARQNRNSGGSSDLQLLIALFDKNRSLALKRALAEQFQEMEGMLVALDGAEGSTIIHQRNKVALEVLRKQLAAGKRKVAIFYGAGHMPDLQQRLRDDFRLRPVSTRWLTAWKLKSPPPPAQPRQPQPEQAGPQ